MKEPILDDGIADDTAKRKKWFKIIGGLTFIGVTIAAIIYVNHLEKKVREKEVLEMQFNELDSLAIEAQKAIKWLDSLPDKTTLDSVQLIK